MSCCGSRRTTIDVRPLARRALPSAPVAAPLRAVAAGDEPRGAAPVAFVYTGPTRLVADGAFSRRRYRFDHPGAMVEVDARDAPAFAAIPQLRRRG